MRAEPKYATARDCPDFTSHFDAHLANSDYLGWMALADSLRKTHKQVRCPSCGFLAHVVPKVTKGQP